jgi:hypothetical protein
MRGIPSAIRRLRSVRFVPRYAPRALKLGFAVMLALAVLLLGASIAGLACGCGWQAMSLVHDGFVVFGAGAIVCWASAVRADAERRALVRLVAKLAGDPPPPSRLHCVS